MVCYKLQESNQKLWTHSNITTIHEMSSRLPLPSAALTSSLAASRPSFTPLMQSEASWLDITCRTETKISGMKSICQPFQNSSSLHQKQQEGCWKFQKKLARTSSVSEKYSSYHVFIWAWLDSIADYVAAHFLFITSRDGSSLNLNW